MHLSKNTIHIWSIDKLAIKTQVDYFRTLLSLNELERANKFHFPKDQERYILSRGALRVILGHYTGFLSNKIELFNDKFGKPRLLCTKKLEFNVSHSGNMSVLAISNGTKIGIDIEAVAPVTEQFEIAEKLFSSEEKRILNEAPVKDRQNLFFRFWTRKEALLKALGTGINENAKFMDTSFVSSSTAKFESISIPWINIYNWNLMDILQWEGYVSALVSADHVNEVRYIDTTAFIQIMHNKS